MDRIDWAMEFYDILRMSGYLTSGQADELADKLAMFVMDKEKQSDGKQ